MEEDNRTIENNTVPPENLANPSAFPNPYYSGEQPQSAPEPVPQPLPEPVPEPTDQLATKTAKNPAKKLTPQSKIIILSVVAAIGFILGIIGLVKIIQFANIVVRAEDDKGDIVTLNPDGVNVDNIVITISDKTPPLGIDNDIAASIVRPYLKDLGLFTDILIRNFNENNKLVVAFENLDPQNLLLSTSGTFRVSYDDLNNIYKYLFGHESNIEKKSYTNIGLIYISEDATSSDYFQIYPSEHGGTGVTKFVAVKNAYFEGEKLIVEMYRQNLSWCLENVTPAPEVCVEPRTVVNENDYAKKQEIINKFGEKIATKKMIFTKDNDHYILIDVTD